ncbi:UDP-N-acetylmuramoyl-L-alanyl-D-glutamate--2,6-diaminopimelate ligase [Dethiobacter alkaliphilus]|uniref:UDP-N-acetylmuramoyl-L-alanyl-D-glutamate--2, 6-diaminopimelate ligase n=1 Tax=Dethiobacter alkaliphilus TaxID=427926 RepID=UPI00222719F6|nr:UDP-N-acetylmuramoyl-L-alanyl-D-glutamate--2,6-diaminopimelate ligase [Dethiobacter alkaliphilus]MCW3491239.1 UDP-N-acetylmuramoyl-L-alanyl-D-glutamate--2,6-diaminopimelate ligase [Dethiobacter alkaliphilus]
MKTLGSITDVLLHKKIAGSPDLEISGIAYHSGKVRPGDLFFCLPGTRSHGRRYVEEAVAAGAVAVVSDMAELETAATVVTVPDVRMALALVSACFYDYPSRELAMIGVTGTNGKTTTTYLIDALLQSSGAATGLLGTVRYHIRGEELPSLATTPEASELQAILRRMKDEGVTYTTMEVSSHALAWHRTIGCDFDTVVLTNITEDHLDFHQTFDHYLASKSKLFSWQGSFPLKGGRRRRAVINGDDKHWQHFADQTPGEVMLYGLSNHCHVRANDVKVERDAVNFRLETPVGGTEITLKMTGLFSVYNSLAAISVGLLEGIDLARIKAVMESVTGVPGRFELVDAGQNFTVIVDYAHTPDGLENVLQAAREFAPARVLTVFGCGGDRDRTKRPLMGEAAGKYSDYCIVTSDNPRSEDPEKIIDEVIPGLESQIDKSAYEIEPDRKAAIRRAMELAQKDDVVIIAGKGHETTQVFRDHTITFDDRQIAGELIRRRLKQDGDDIT